MYKIRARYTKTDMMKFISHLDLVRLMQRALRRADVSMVFSQGFNPHPKLSFATALSVGVSSEGEYMDVEIKDFIELEIFKEKINHSLPDGIKIIQCKYIDPKAAALMASIDYSSYLVRLRLENPIQENAIKANLEHFTSLEEIRIHKKTNKRNNEKEKEINIRTYIHSVEIFSLAEEELILKMVLATGSRGNVKPDAVVQSLAEIEGIAIDYQQIRIHRLELYSVTDGKMVSPLGDNS